jgi:hypothetical protein
MASLSTLRVLGLALQAPGGLVVQKGNSACGKGFVKGFVGSGFVRHRLG